MRSRAVRVTLLLLAVGALGAAAYLSWSAERRTAATVQTHNTIAWKLEAVARQTIELRAAQQAYVAAGQSEQFWITRVAESITQLEDGIADIRNAPLSADTQAALERATQALAQFSRFDRRAREYASTGQKLLASDIVFSDGLQRAQQVLIALDEARTAEAVAVGASVAQGRRELATTAGGGVAVALLVLLLLTSRGRMPVPEPLPLPEPKPVVEPKRVATVRTAPAPAKRAEPVMKRPESADPDLAIKPAAASVKPAPALPELNDIAEVCTQLARAADSSTLPTILQRTALALNAAGVVLWVSDPEGSELVPVASHGYAPAVVARMGTLPRDAENVTAAAFRTGVVHTMKGDALSNGAIAAPLVNTSGCVGVLSAEMRNEGERESARLAVASIVAAQLATITAPASRVDNRAAL
jgi:Tfp pilus assembly protein PilV